MVRLTKETLSFGHQVQKTEIFIPNPILITPGAGIGLVTSYDKIPSSMERFEEVLIPQMTKTRALKMSNQKFEKMKPKTSKSKTTSRIKILHFQEQSIFPNTILKV